ncbi:Hypothetical predicted protein [Octopus vulgaris]|uniref:Uncharacterized protein n=1 Tax=Octopus vulgaris TaxID=6645 RepID=A0AA36AQN0_OCTVU|nr:Hypothetical predicted protein [Octopus vulgaris]
MCTMRRGDAKEEMQMEKKDDSKETYQSTKYQHKLQFENIPIGSKEFNTKLGAHNFKYGQAVTNCDKTSIRNSLDRAANLVEDEVLYTNIFHDLLLFPVSAWMPQ